MLEQPNISARNSPKNLNLWFVSTAAEEEGLVGMVNFMHNYAEQFDKKKSFFINLDSVSGSGKLRLISDRKQKTPLKSAVEVAAEDETVVLSKPRFLPGIGFDSIPVSFRGYDAVSIARCGYKQNPVFDTFKRGQFRQNRGFRT
jgi:Zn-dependent M28 family amino/carboxypeptidase